MILRATSCVILGCGLVAAGLGVARASMPQRPTESLDARAGEPAPPADGRDALESNRAEALRARIERRLAETKHQLERLTERRQSLAEAIEQLDAGEEPAAVMRDLVGSGRDRWHEARKSRAQGRGAWRDRRQDESGRAATLEGLDRLEPAFPLLVGSIRRTWRAMPSEQGPMRDRLRTRIRELLELRDQDPELAEVRAEEFRTSIELHLAARELHAAYSTDEGVEPALDRVRDAMADVFDAKVAAQRLEITRLGERIIDLQREVNERVENRESLIQEQAERLKKKARAYAPPRD